MATTTVKSDEEAPRKVGRPSNAELKAREEARAAAEAADKELLHQPDPADPLRSGAPPQQMPLSVDELRTRPREMLPEAARAAAGPNRHADRVATPASNIPRPTFVKIPSERAIGADGEPYDRARPDLIVDPDIQRAFDPRNPVFTMTWTDEEGPMTPEERSENRRRVRDDKRAIAAARMTGAPWRDREARTR